MRPTPTRRMSPAETALRAAIAAAPDAPLPRLVYADWLDDYDQPTHAAAVRRDVARAAQRPWADRYWQLLARRRSPRRLRLAGRPPATAGGRPRRLEEPLAGGAGVRQPVVGSAVGRCRPVGRLQWTEAERTADRDVATGGQGVGDVRRRPRLLNRDMDVAPSDDYSFGLLPTELQHRPRVPASKTSTATYAVPCMGCRAGQPTRQSRRTTVSSGTRARHDPSTDSARVADSVTEFGVICLDRLPPWKHLRSGRRG